MPEPQPARISPDLVRAGEIARQRAADTARFEAYAENCKATGRLQLPECAPANELLLADFLTQDLRKRMGQKRWEDFRFYNKIAPGFEQDVQRMFAQVERSQRAQESWLKGMANPSMPR